MRKQGATKKDHRSNIMSRALFLIALLMGMMGTLKSGWTELLTPIHLGIFQEGGQVGSPGYFKAMEVDSNGNVYLATMHEIVQYNEEEGVFRRIAGNGILPYDVEDGPAIDLSVSPEDLTLSPQGDVYFLNGEWYITAISKDGIASKVSLYLPGSSDPQYLLISRFFASPQTNRFFFYGSGKWYGETGDKADVLYIMQADQNGLVTKYVGGGDQSIDRTPRNRLDVSVDGADQVYSMPDNTLFFAWHGRILIQSRLYDHLYMAEVTPKDEVSLFFDIGGDNIKMIKYGAFLSKEMFCVGRRARHEGYAPDRFFAEVITPGSTESRPVAVFPENPAYRWPVADQAYFAYWKERDVLYIMLQYQREEKLELWKIPDVLARLQSGAQDWALYE
ncbi:MAG: hypothetical protein GC154_11195 [bacterium]|nr:hypothetical protein [bacterium]